MSSHATFNARCSNRRVKRRAATEAEKKIKKIADDVDEEDLVIAKQHENARKKHRNEGPTTPTGKSLFFECDSVSSFSISLPSLSSIPEGSCLSESTTLMSDQDIELANKEMEREIRRQKRLINSTGTMYLSEKSAHRMSLFSPQTSPYKAIALELTPYVGLPTTPLEKYQCQSAPAKRASGRSARRAVSSSFDRRLRHRNIEGSIEPRKLIM